jgi:hypothetical protein
VLPEEELLQQAAGAGVVAERMGLTPDWIISTTAFNVFQLPVRGLAASMVSWQWDRSIFPAAYPSHCLPAVASRDHMYA